jgi:hypothetical protein
MEVNLLRRRLKVLLSDENETVAKYYDADSVTVLRSGKPQLKKSANAENPKSADTPEMMDMDDLTGMDDLNGMDDSEDLAGADGFPGGEQA